MSDNPLQQGEWLVQRIGKVTASNAYKLMDRTQKGLPTAKRQEYLMDIVTQRLTGQQTPVFVNAAMQWGIDQEGFARAEYEKRTGQIVDLCGFIQHPTLLAGASPDGYVGLDGLVEFKCPQSTTHLDYILNGPPAQYIAQMQFQMWITGMRWCDFVSYDPRLPANICLYRHCVERDSMYIDRLASEVETFLAEVEKTIANITEKAK